MKIYSITLGLLLFVLLHWKNAAANEGSSAGFGCSLTNIGDTIPVIRQDTIPKSQDSVLARQDTVLTLDTFPLRLSKDSMQGPVKYTARDSAVVMMGQKQILLYGQTQTVYNDVQVAAPKVVVDQQTNMITATADRDSLGNLLTRARFEQGENKFQSDTIRFNFKTQQGITRNTFTQQGEMFVQGDKIKKIDSATVFISSGRLTTCSYDDPHFAFRTNRVKVINNKLAITGPTHPEFEGVPLPVYLPFGFFPMSQGRHSGFLAPEIATNEQFGLGLEGLGYYKVLNEYFDVRLQGNIYSYGTWSAQLAPTYIKRYRYRGQMNLNFQRTKNNFKGDPDYNLFKTFQINWTHSMDQKARPGTTFSANVNAGSTRFNELIPNNPQRNFTNQLTSSIAYSKTWGGRYNLTLSANHSQNSRNRLTQIALPDGGFTMTTLYPFQRKTVLGAKKWYENLGIGYNGTFRNQLGFYDTADIKFSQLIDTMQWGALHRIPITLSLPPAGPIILSPGISYQQAWIQTSTERNWNKTTNKLDTIRNKGFFLDQEVTFSMSASTNIFGTMRFQRSRVAAIRHVVRPQISANYRPDLSKKYYYESQLSADTTNKVRMSRLAGNVVSAFSAGEFGGLSFGIDNNLEMKWRSRKDTGENAIKKVRLIDGFGFNSGYNFLADTNQLQDFNLYLRSTLLEKINITASALLSPYQTNKFGRPSTRYAWADGFRLGTLQYGSLAISTSFQSKEKTDGREADAEGEDDEPLVATDGRITDPTLLADQQALMDYMRQNPAEFVNFNIRWQLSLSFSAGFTRTVKSDYSGFENVFNANVSFNNSFNLTPKWNFSTNGYYDFRTLKLQTFTMSISRDMHCWQMSVNVTPVGPYRFFSFTINPKASLLQDLRVNRSRTFSNY